MIDKGQWREFGQDTGVTTPILYEKTLFYTLGNKGMKAVTLSVAFTKRVHTGIFKEHFSS